MSQNIWDLVANHFDPTARPNWDTPLAMGAELDPARTKTTPALQLIANALVEAFNTPDSRLIISMPPQEGKSQLSSRRFPLWCLTQNPDLRVAVASYEANIARRWGRAVRDDITTHQHRLGLTVRSDVAAQAEWQLSGHEGGLFTAGVGGAMTGRAVDLLLIDDPVKGREQADSEKIRQKTWDWYTDVALTRLSPGAPVILILTRWHEDDLAGRLMKNEPGVWQFLRIPAQADSTDDPLGREPGQYLQSVRGRTTAQWEARKKASGPVTWASLYQGTPTPPTGGIFPQDWPTYDTPFWIERPDGTRIIPQSQDQDLELIQSWDLTFKDTANSDYVVGQVWLRNGANAYLLDQVRGRMSFTKTVEAVKDLTARWPQAAAKFVEDKANGPAVINALQRTVPGLIPVEPEGGKVARANAVSPFAYAGNVILPEAHLLPSVQELRSECLNFPHAAHDDTVDAMTQAINQLLLHPLVTDGADRYGSDDMTADYTFTAY